jgi:hypothetical protein
MEAKRVKEALLSDLQFSTQLANAVQEQEAIEQREEAEEQVVIRTQCQWEGGETLLSRATISSPSQKRR